MLEFRLPDIGEGLTEAEIVSWMVAVGDRVKEDQAIVAIETDVAAPGDQIFHLEVRADQNQRIVVGDRH